MVEWPLCGHFSVTQPNINVYPFLCWIIWLFTGLINSTRGLCLRILVLRCYLLCSISKHSFSPPARPAAVVRGPAGRNRLRQVHYLIGTLGDFFYPFCTHYNMYHSIQEIERISKWAQRIYYGYPFKSYKSLCAAD